MIKQFLEVHNSARKAVGVPPLKWEPLLATYARIYSNQQRHGCTLVHSTALTFGENVFIGQGHRWTAQDAAAAWMAEKQFYHYPRTTHAPGPTAPTTPRLCGAPPSGWGAPRSFVTMVAASSLASIIHPGTMLDPGHTNFLQLKSKFVAIDVKKKLWLSI